MVELRAAWLRLQASLWFVPALVVAGCMVLAVVLVDVDGHSGADLARRWPRLFGAGAEGARAMLSAIGTSVITVAGVVFSVTIVALSQASTQYSPRVLHTFMRDRPTQLVLAVFVGCFAYCLMVLRTIHGTEDQRFVRRVEVHLVEVRRRLGVDAAGPHEAQGAVDLVGEALVAAALER